MNVAKELVSNILPGPSGPAYAVNISKAADEYEYCVMDQGIPLGLRSLDDVLGGLQPGTLTGITSHTSGAGKSALMMNSAVAAWSDSFEVAFHSAQMLPSSLQQMAYAIGAHVSLERMRLGVPHFDPRAKEKWEEEQLRIREFRKRMEEDNVPFLVSSDTSWSSISASVTGKRAHALYIDGLPLNVTEAWADDLKALAMEHEVAVIVSAQAPARIRGKRHGVSMDTVKNADDFLRASDLVLGVHPTGDKAIISPVLYRYGPRPYAVEIAWDWDTMQVTEYGADFDYFDL